MEFLAKLTIFIPLLSSILSGINIYYFRNYAGFVASLCMAICALSATYIFIHVGIGANMLHIVLFRWIAIGDFGVSWSIYLDQLTAIMFIIVSYVSFVVHIYSLGYMKKDKTLAKFLSYLSLFTFFMLALVASDNLLQLFFGWEGVGLCSYLLIGYYYQKQSASIAAIKAFIVNRVGDFALIIAICLIGINYGTLEYVSIFSKVDKIGVSVIEIFGLELDLIDLICLMLFIGCMGKSAQLGLHVWLPDAMEGPTPVSALIHAATMVTAGVFLLARFSRLFELSPLILAFITVVGATTCLFAALVAIAQTDIKKIIAYSTCSQLGYMIFACGVSAYQVAIFHLITHGFFKALLFLSAGSVIHATHEQNIFKLGGLASKMPITYANFCLASLAIIGVFPFSGFYSKDLILEAAYGAGGVGILAFIFGVMVAILTAIYSMKIIILTFHGKSRLPQDTYDKVVEAMPLMNVPLLILLVGTLFSGMYGYYILSIDNPYGYFHGSIYSTHHHSVVVPQIIHMLPLMAGLFGIFFGYYCYNSNRHKQIARSFRLVHNILENKFYFDEIYSKLIVKPVTYLSVIFKKFDYSVIDRFGPLAGASIVKACSWCVCQLQTGYIFSYILYFILSITICLTLYISKIFFMLGA